MAGALAYPFALFGRRAVLSLIGIILFVLMLAAVDIAFAAAGQDLITTSPFDGQSRGAYQFYNLISTLISTFCGAMVMATALIDLKRRDEAERPSVADGIGQIVLNIKYAFTVLLPFGLLVIGAAIVGRAGGMWAGIAAGFVIACAWIFVSVRLYVAWPMSVMDNEAKLWRAWPKTKNHFWPLLGMLVIIYGLGMLPLFAVGGALGGFGLLPDFPVETLDAALEPEVLAIIGIQDLGVAFLTFYTAAAAAFLYNSVDPTLAGVADEFA